MISEEFLKERLEFLHDQIQQAVVSSGRDKKSVKLIAISKFHPVKTIVNVFNYGQKAFGENYVQEAIYKQSELSGLPIEWHFTGRLQTNNYENEKGEKRKITEVIAEKLTFLSSNREILEKEGVNKTKEEDLEV